MDVAARPAGYGRGNCGQPGIFFDGWEYIALAEVDRAVWAEGADAELDVQRKGGNGIHWRFWLGPPGEGEKRLLQTGESLAE